MDIFNIETVNLREDDVLVILDQTRLPGEVIYLELRTQAEIWSAINLLRVRGAPAIGVAAAIGIFLAAKEIESNSYESFYAEFLARKDYLASARPTAVNLFWALDRMESCLVRNRDKEICEIISALRAEAVLIRDEDIEVCRKIGEYGSALLKDGMGILTHCNAGTLAAAKYGTALSPIYTAVEKKGYKNIRVYCDETRPLLQGARLTAFELLAAGLDTTLICDNMASIVMKNGFVDAIFVGCDRVAANGDTANKIGTSGLAIIAKHYGIPFYVCCPGSTIDMNTKSGDLIHIEERGAEEITTMFYEKPMAPAGVSVYNPAFDVTEASLISAIITEYGIARAPYGESLGEIIARMSAGRDL